MVLFHSLIESSYWLVTFSLVPCKDEDGPILIRKKTFAASIRKDARGSRRMVFKSIFFAVIVS
jgi:hypothetical protein